MEKLQWKSCALCAPKTLQCAMWVFCRGRIVRAPQTVCGRLCAADSLPHTVYGELRAAKCATRTKSQCQTRPKGRPHCGSPGSWGPVCGRRHTCAPGDFPLIVRALFARRRRPIGGQVAPLWAGHAPAARTKRAPPDRDRPLSGAQPAQRT